MEYEEEGRRRIGRRKEECAGRGALPDHAGILLGTPAALDADVWTTYQETHDPGHHMKG